jgi:hypothetical protein
VSEPYVVDFGGGPVALPGILAGIHRLSVAEQEAEAAAAEARHAHPAWTVAGEIERCDDVVRLRELAILYRQVLLEQHEAAGHLVPGECGPCASALAVLDPGLACDRRKGWQRNYVAAVCASATR